jgi:hypothetical protein
MKRHIYTALAAGFFFGSVLSAKAWEKTFFLQGVREFMATESSDRCCETTFLGAIKNADSETIGSFVAVLDFKEIEDMEACRGKNDITRLTLTMVFTSGNYAGNKLVAGMRDRRGMPDVFWDHNEDKYAIGDLKGGCPTSEDSMWDPRRDDGMEVTIARLGKEAGIRLGVKRGTTTAFFNMKQIFLKGWLCHDCPHSQKLIGSVRMVRYP